MTQRLCVVGAGAVGGVLAAVMAGSGCNVGVYGKRQGELEVIIGSRITRLDVNVPSGDECDYVLLTVKYYDTMSAVEYLKDGRLSTSTLIVIQNGLGGLELAESILQQSERMVVAGGVADVGAYRSGHRIRLEGEGWLYVGCRGRDCTNDLVGLARCFRSPLVRLALVDDVEPYRRMKTAVNAAINTISSLLMQENGVILDSPWLLRAARIITSKAAGYLGVDGDEAEGKLLEILERTRNNRSSMLQDIQSCRRTEVEAILGPLVDGVAEARILYYILKGIEEVRLGGCGGMNG